MKICTSDYMANVNYMKQTECSKNDEKMNEKPTGERNEKGCGKNIPFSSYERAKI